MKILFNAMTLGIGGAERVINILSNELIKDNDVKIITNINQPLGYEFNNKINIECLEKKQHIRIVNKLLKFSVFNILRLKKSVENYNPDIIISFLPTPSFRILFLKKYCPKIKNIPVIVAERNNPNMEYKKNIYNFIMRKLYPYANGFVFQTDDAKKYFKDIINCKQAIILNPVDEVFLNSKRNLAKRKNEIVNVGRIFHQKNQFLLIDAFKIVCEKHDDYVLKIFGSGPDEKKLEKYIIKNNLEKKAFLMGSVKDINKHINDSSLFVLSSNYEGMPNALLEAMSLGIPCVSTDCPIGGPRMLIENGENGFLVPVGDCNQLALAMIKVLDNPKLGEKFSENSMKKCKLLSKTNIVNQWKDFIMEVLDI